MSLKRGLIVYTLDLVIAPDLVYFENILSVEETRYEKKPSFYFPTQFQAGWESLFLGFV